jgi:DedD protein
VASQFKNRLVGVIILVALVVIFLPSVIDGKKESYKQEFAVSPSRPELKEHSQGFETISVLKEKQIVIENMGEKKIKNIINENATEWKVEELPEPIDIEDNTELAVANPPSNSAVVSNSTTVETKKALTETAWTIQLGAFQNKENINSLLKKLNNAGFQVHTIPHEVVDGQLTRVFVGPDISKKKLEEQLPRLKRLTNLNGKLVPFNPIEP